MAKVQDNQQPRRQFSVAKKMEILKYGEKHSSKEAREKYGISDGLYYKWKTSYAETTRTPTKKKKMSPSQPAADTTIEKSWCIDSDDEYIILRIPKKEVTKHLLSTLL